MTAAPGPLAYRRQRAREAFASVTSWPVKGEPVPSAGDLAAGIGAAIEAAIRVRITPEIIDASMAEPFIATRDALARAFRAAGFEVEE